MKANEFRNQTIRNTRLAWLVHGYKVPLESLKDFTKEELKQIRKVEDDEEVLKEINRLVND